MDFSVRLCVVVLVLAATPGRAAEPSHAAADARSAVIRSELSRERGAITALEASRLEGGGVIAGYTSGAVLQCFDDGHCREFDGTPSSSAVGGVEAIAVSPAEGREVCWVAYPHGVLYRCARFVCREVTTPGQP